MKRLNKQQGFTMIELIVVIVILGILAVTAAPKFISMTTDANKSVITGLKGSMASAMQIVYAKSAIEGEETKAGQVISTLVTTEFGYPEASLAGILAAMDVVAKTDKTGEWVYAPSTVTIDSVSVPTILIAPTSKVSATIVGAASSADVTDSNCYVTYTEATSATVAATAVVTATTGC